MASPSFWKNLKTVAGDDVIGINVMVKVFDEITYTLFIIFHSSFSDSIFPEQLKLAKVFPMFKVGNIEEVGNCSLISVLLIFFKVLETIWLLSK